jgi:hypothetical protein
VEEQHKTYKTANKHQLAGVLPLVGSRLRYWILENGLSARFGSGLLLARSAALDGEDVVLYEEPMPLALAHAPMVNPSSTGSR